MREGQYQIPQTSMLHAGGPESEVNNKNALLYQQQAELLASQDKEASYGAEAMSELRSREGRIDWYRHEALHTPVEVSRSLGGKILTLITGERGVQPTMTELLEKESLAGGELFQVTSRFWLHPSTGGHDDTRDWYFNFHNTAGEYTIHYQTSSQGVFKLYNGKEYAFTDGELERFVAASSAYEAAIVKDVYQREPVVRAA